MHVTQAQWYSAMGLRWVSVHGQDGQYPGMIEALAERTRYGHGDRCSAQR